MATRGAYETRQSREIAAYFRGHPEKCATAEEVYAALGAAVGMTTVYRVTARLCREGCLRRYTARDTGEAALYQWNPCGENHLHIRCVDCGVLQHLSCEAADEFADHLKGRHGFVLDEEQTVLYGRCAQCEAERAKKKRS